MKPGDKVIVKEERSIDCGKVLTLEKFNVHFPEWSVTENTDVYNEEFLQQVEAIEYGIFGNMCLPECKYIDKMVGGYSCYICKYCKKRDKENQIVYCSYKGEKMALELKEFSTTIKEILESEQGCVSKTKIEFVLWVIDRWGTLDDKNIRDDFTSIYSWDQEIYTKKLYKYLIEHGKHEWAKWLVDNNYETVNDEVRKEIEKLEKIIHENMWCVNAYKARIKELEKL